MIRSNPSPIVYADISTKPEQVLFQLPQTTQIIFDYLGKTYAPNLPKGWTTDLGSVPAAARGIISNSGAVDIAYVLHDAIYGTDWPSMCPQGHAFSRLDADTILYLKLKERGMNEIKARIVYWAVRAFGGGSHWRHSA
jgi:hypothetical protein